MFIEQAYKGNNELWRVILTTIVTTGIFVAGLIQFFFFDVDVVAEMEKMYAMVPDKNFWLAVNLIPFAVLLGLLFVLVWGLHQRSIITLTTARKRIDWSRVGFAILIVVIYQAITMGVVFFTSPEDLVLQFQPVNFAILFIISLLLFPFQIGLEEWLFRGYLMQQLGIIARNRWFPLLFTSAFFGIAHWANPEVAAMGSITMVYYIGTGLFLGVLALMDDGLELSLGYHFANNFLASILVTTEYSALQTDAIFKSIAPPAAGAEIVLPVVIVFPIMLYIFAKKYKWTNWKERLLGPVNPPQEEVVATEIQ